MNTYKATAKQMKELGSFKAIKLNKAQEITAEATIIIMNETEARVEFVTGEEKTIKIDTLRRGWEVIEENNLEVVDTAIEQTEVTSEQTADTVQDTDTGEHTQDTAEAQEQPEQTSQEGQALQIEAQEGVSLTEALVSATAKGGDKFFYRFELKNQLLEIVDYGTVTMQVNVYSEGSQVYKSPKLSVQDALLNHFNMQGEELTLTRKAITSLKKQAKYQWQARA